MSLWLQKTVEELVADKVLAKPLDGNHGSIHPKTSDYVPVGIPFIMASDLLNGQVDTKGCNFISAEQADKLRKGFAKTGDVLLSHKATIGRVAIVGKIATPFIMLTPQVTYYRITDPNTLNHRFLYYYFQSRPFLEVLGQWAGAGSTRAYLGITGQLKLPIALPPISEQRAIAAVLGALDDKIEVNRKTAATLEAMARALYRSWFVDFDPVHARSQGQPPAHMDQTTAALFPNRIGDDGLPEGWANVPIYNLAKVQYGAPFKSKLFNTENDGRPLVRIRDLKNQRAGVFTTEVSNKEYLIRPGDTVVGMDGDFTPYTWCAEPSLMNQRVCAFLPLRSEDKAFVRYAIPALLKAEENAAVATTVIHLGKKDIDTFQIVDSGEDVRSEFAKIANPMVEKFVTLGLQNQTLATLRDTLLPKLMSGELRVGAARKQVGEVV